MSREIKFRFWDAENKKMVVRQSLYELQKYSVHPELNDTAMQYTGLKDKNGVEIYEGDIVLVDNDDGQYKSEVYFDGGALCINVEGCDFDFIAIGWALGCNTNIHSIEVIGNIHENKHLIDNN